MKVLSLLATLALAAPSRANDCPVEPSGFAGGDGSFANPYLVCSADQLQLVGSFLGVGINFRQVADIDLEGYAFTPIGATTFGGAPLFNGTYDGNGYEVRNLEIIAPGTDVIGLFAKITPAATLRNVAVRDCNVSGRLCVAGVVTENRGLVEGCSATGTVSGQQYIGGVLGDNQNDVRNCWAEVDVDGGDSVGGLIGVHFGPLLPTVSSSWSAGPVMGGSNVGGLVGRDLGSSAVVTSSFWDVAKSGQATSVGGTGLSTAAMQMEATFNPPWDFLTVWTIDEGAGYPRLQLELLREQETFCDASDGALASCPCANPGSPDTGCDIQQGTGGVELCLVAQETSPANRVTFHGTGFPAASTPAGIVIRASSLDPAGPVVFGDGLRCIGVPLVRLGAAFASGGVSQHVFGHGVMAGSGPFYYQLWFRNTPVMFCDPVAAFNLSNGRSLIW
jgi:hypothetical protein